MASVAGSKGEASCHHNHARLSARSENSHDNFPQPIVNSRGPQSSRIRDRDLPTKYRTGRLSRGMRAPTLEWKDRNQTPECAKVAGLALGSLENAVRPKLMSIRCPRAEARSKIGRQKSEPPKRS